MSKLTHFDDEGRAQMVDVGAKPETAREAVASGRVLLRAETLARVRAGTVDKGDVLGTARLAAIAGLKRTSELIPLCHPLRVTGVEVALEATDQGGPPRVEIRATVRAFDRTGVEMEALTAVAVAGLTLYDMLKAIDRDMVIGEVRLEAKRGGKSGDWTRQSG
jgi:cyclic pyranopterin phosphate synthase